MADHGQHIEVYRDEKEFMVNGGAYRLVNICQYKKKMQIKSLEKVLFCSLTIILVDMIHYWIVSIVS